MSRRLGTGPGGQNSPSARRVEPDPPGRPDRPGPPDPDDEIQKAKNAAFRLLSGRDYTRAEIRKKLRGRQFSGAAIEATMVTLEGLNLVDDRAFARKWVESRLKGRPMGRFRLALELKRRGIPEDLVDETLDQALAEVDPIALALPLLQGRAARYRGLERQKALARMYQFLGRRGFEAQVAREAARLAWEALGQEETDSV